MPEPFPPTLEGALEEAQTFLEDMFPTLDPDEDPSQTLTLYDDDSREMTLAMLAVPGGEAVAAACASLIATNNPHRIVLVMAAWMARQDPDNPDDGYLPPSMREDRIEIVNVVAAARGDVEPELLMATAEIHRHPGRPPTLGEWTRQGGQHAHEGRIPDAIRAGFFLAAGRDVPPPRGGLL